MCRRARMSLPGFPYHVVQRGNNRETCFIEPESYQFYLQLWEGVSSRYQVVVHADCLMTNHIHFLATSDTSTALSNTLKVVGSRYANVWPGSNDTGFIQYTSGSTGDPKGVVLSRDNLISKIRAAGEAVRATDRDVFVSWLPLYHDMGLIGAWFGSMYFGVELVIMSPMVFLGRPVRWLRAIQRHGGTISAAPNFTYGLCVTHIPEEDLEGLDLRRLPENGIPDCAG